MRSSGWLPSCTAVCGRHFSYACASRRHNPAHVLYMCACTFYFSCSFDHAQTVQFIGSREIPARTLPESNVHGHQRVDPVESPGANLPGVPESVRGFTETRSCVTCMCCSYVHEYLPVLLTMYSEACRRPWRDVLRPCCQV